MFKTDQVAVPSQSAHTKLVSTDILHAPETSVSLTGKLIWTSAQPQPYGKGKDLGTGVNVLGTCGQRMLEVVQSGEQTASGNVRT